jgi:hypothetical protein
MLCRASSQLESEALHCTLCQMISCSLHFWKHDVTYLKWDFSHSCEFRPIHILSDYCWALLINLKRNEVAWKWVSSWFRVQAGFNFPQKNSNLKIQIFLKLEKQTLRSRYQHLKLWQIDLSCDKNALSCLTHASPFVLIFPSFI